MKQNALLVMFVFVFAIAGFSQKQISYEARLKDLKIVLPPAPSPVASYVPAVRSGDLIFLA